MCIIAIIPIGNELLTEEEFKYSLRRNPNGNGFMFVDGDDELQIFTSLNFEKFYDTLKYSFKHFNETSPFVIHLRGGQYPGRTEENCHPFYITKNVGFCHNGFISGLPDNKELFPLWSDTRKFNALVLQKVPEDYLFNPAFRTLIQNRVTTDKLVFLNNKRQIFVINERLGNYHNKIWCSNFNYTYNDRDPTEKKKEIKGNTKSEKVFDDDDSFDIEIGGYFGLGYYSDIPQYIPSNSRSRNHCYICGDDTPHLLKQCFVMYGDLKEKQWLCTECRREFERIP